VGIHLLIEVHELIVVIPAFLYFLKIPIFSGLSYDFLRVANSFLYFLYFFLAVTITSEKLQEEREGITKAKQQQRSFLSTSYALLHEAEANLSAALKERDMDQIMFIYLFPWQPIQLDLKTVIAAIKVGKK
jgi:hypothetical protein